jgi:hypothetical protein
MKYYFFNYVTNELDPMGEHVDWKTAYDTVVDKTSGIVLDEDRWRSMANDTRYPGGIKIQNARTKRTYRIIEVEDGTLRTEGPFPSPPPEPPRKWHGD